MREVRRSGWPPTPDDDQARDLSEGMGAFLRARRLAAGLTQAELADRAGAGLGTVRDLEQGRTRRPSAGLAVRLAAALDLDAAGEEEFARVARAQAAAADAGPLGGRWVRGGVWLQVLGPVEAWRAGKPVGLGAFKHRMVLGVLAVVANTLVHRDALVDALWGEDPPATAVHLVQSYVSGLRNVLDPGRSPREPVRLMSVGASYRLQASAGQLDLLAFEQLADCGHAARTSGDLAGACDLYERALGFWRGQPLADLDVLQRYPAVIAISQRRSAVICDYADTAREAGTPERVLPHLWELAGREPLDEQVHGRLIIALVGTGRQAAALNVFEELRSRLDHELGVCPGPYLADVHLLVLRQEVPVAARLLTMGSDHAAAGNAVSAVPRQLPQGVPHFTGREAELAALTGLLEGAAAGRDTVVISAIGGTAGVGKTALAVHWAHRVAERFPDGQLYVDLRGYDPGQPVPAADALAGFLRALGVAGQDIPAEPAERAANYRSLLAGRQVLVVLDNAGSAEQARPLLPAAPGCVALVTSRDSLAGLVARDGAVRVDLDLLPLDEAVGLLRALIGDRVDADPDAATALADRCARLPLALRLAAELAVAHPARPLASLAGELAEQQRRLDLLDGGGDPRTAVRAVFSWSYRHLHPAAARAFRLTGLHPGPDLDRYAAAALTGAPPELAGQLVDQLARAHLIYASGRSQYRMHDLLRGYARELAADQDGEEEQRAALTRLFDYYLHTSAAAMNSIFPAECHRRPQLPPPASGPPVTEPGVAREWLDAQRASLVAVAAHTATHGWPGHATRLAATLFRYLDAGGHYPEAATVHASARRAAQQNGDRGAEATALSNLGAADLRQGRYQQATGHLRQALAICRQTGDLDGQARALSNIGLADLLQGRYRQATSHHQRALALYRQAGNRTGEARRLGNIGLVDLLQGRYEQAASRLTQALALSHDTGERTGEAYALTNLGCVYLRQGQYQAAIDHHQHALALFRETGDRPGEAHTLADLGCVYLRRGMYQEATGYQQRALALSREIGDRSGQTEALNGLGEILLATGHAGHARTQHAAALSLAGQIGDKYEQARAHNGLARSYHATGDPARARQHWQHALTRYASLEVPEADQIRAHLTAADNHGNRDP